MARFSLTTSSGKFADVLAGRRTFAVIPERPVDTGDVIRISGASVTDRHVFATVTTVDREGGLRPGFMAIGFRVEGELNDVIQSLYQQLDEARGDYDEAFEALRVLVPDFEPARRREAA